MSSAASSVCVCLWSARSAACLLKANAVSRQAGGSRKDRTKMEALVGTAGWRAHWELSCAMPCCRGKAKPWSMLAVNQILFVTLLLFLPPWREGSDSETWKVVVVILKRRSNR